MNYGLKALQMCSVITKVEAIRVFLMTQEMLKNDRRERLGLLIDGNSLPRPVNELQYLDLQ